MSLSHLMNCTVWDSSNKHLSCFPLARSGLITPSLTEVFLGNTWEVNYKTHLIAPMNITRENNQTHTSPGLTINKLYQWKVRTNTMFKAWTLENVLAPESGFMSFCSTEIPKKQRCPPRTHLLGAVSWQVCKIVRCWHVTCCFALRCLLALGCVRHVFALRIVHVSWCSFIGKAASPKTNVKTQSSDQLMLSLLLCNCSPLAQLAPASKCSS